MLKLLYLENTSYQSWTFKFLSLLKCSCLILSMSCFSDLIYMTHDVEACTLVSSISIFESRPNSTPRQVIQQSSKDIGLDDYAQGRPSFLSGCFQMLLLLSILDMATFQLGFLTIVLDYKTKKWYGNVLVLKLDVFGAVVHVATADLADIKAASLVWASFFSFFLSLQFFKFSQFSFRLFTHTL